MGTLCCIVFSPQISKLTNIRFELIAPFVFVIIAFAAFQSGQNLLDLVTLFVIGLVGIFLRRFYWSRPAFLIGFVLANPVENFSNNAVQIANIRYRNDGLEGALGYMFSPIVLALIVIPLVSVILGLRQGKYIQAEGAVPAGRKRAPLVFLIIAMAFVITMLVNVASIPNYARVDAIFPQTVATITLICCLILFAQMCLRPETDAVFADREFEGDDAKSPSGLWATLSWFAGLLLATAFFGFIIALTGFLLLFFKLRANTSWIRTLILCFSGLVIMLGMAWMLKRDFPPGWLQTI